MPDREGGTAVCAFWWAWGEITAVAMQGCGKSQGRDVGGDGAVTSPGCPYHGGERKLLCG